jgi:hypothetical protein
MAGESMVRLPKVEAFSERGPDMSDPQLKLNASSLESVNDPPLESSVSDILGLYGRLLSEYISSLKNLDINPFEPLHRAVLLALNLQFQLRVWSSVAEVLKVPNTLQQELPNAHIVLTSVEALSDSQLHALVRCSRLNMDKLSSRVIYSRLSKAFVAAAAVLGMAKALKEVMGINIIAYIPAEL